MIRKDPDPLAPIHGDASGDGRLTRLLRNSHIFSSAVREIVETKFLAEVATDALSLPQFHVLKLIALNGHHKIGEVAEFLGVSSPAITKNIDKLESLGLVSRMPDATDRRATLLEATAQGRALVEQYEALKAQRLAPVLDRFRPEEIEQLSHLLERFSVLLFDQEHADRGFCLRCAAYCQERCPVGHVLGHCPYEKIRNRNHPMEDGEDGEDAEEADGDGP